MRFRYHGGMSCVVSMEVFKKALEEKPANTAFLDVRTPEEYKALHIPGVENLPIDELPSHVEKLRRMSAVYVHCKAGGRAGKACALLDEFRLPNVCRMDGGLDTWEHAGYPVVRG